MAKGLFGPGGPPDEVIIDACVDESEEIIRKPAHTPVRCGCNPRPGLRGTIAAICLDNVDIAVLLAFQIPDTRLEEPTLREALPCSKGHRPPNRAVCGWCAGDDNHPFISTLRRSERLTHLA
jgi:hypothetical protein